MFICLVTTNEFVRCWLFYSVLHKSSAACVALCDTANSHQQVCTLLACVFYFSCTSSHAREKKKRQRKKRKRERDKKERAPVRQPASQPVRARASERQSVYAREGERERRRKCVSVSTNGLVGPRLRNNVHTHVHTYTHSHVLRVCVRER